MVHALEKAASCLNRGGVILEVHDLVDPPRIEVHSDGAEIFAGQLLSEVNFEKQQFADDAIGQVVAAGKLTSDQAIVFESYIRSDSLESMTKWLEEEWASVYIPENTHGKVIDLASNAGKSSEVVIRFVSRLNLLKSVTK